MYRAESAVTVTDGYGPVKWSFDQFLGLLNRSVDLIRRPLVFPGQSIDSLTSRKG
jgi:hypothetical protein